ncbi:MAG: DUF1080 domain-containing protein [Opitutaceae bacterium]|nr:DUF1080 domain-containing protein [Opitutaceae bacterium]
MIIRALFLISLLCLTQVSAADLLNGRDFTGWELISLPTTPAAINAVCHYNTDGSLAVAGQPVCYLTTTATYENYTLHAEWRWTDKPGNGGILLHIASGPKDRAWPLCHQVQTKNKSVGDLIPMAGATFAEPLDPAAKVPARTHSAIDSEKPVGAWNSCDIVCRDGTIIVTVNGVLQNKISRATPHSGRIGFQLEGIPFELRAIRLTPL